MLTKQATPTNHDSDSGLSVKTPEEYTVLSLISNNSDAHRQLDIVINQLY